MRTRRRQGHIQHDWATRPPSRTEEAIAVMRQMEVALEAVCGDAGVASTWNSKIYVDAAPPGRDVYILSLGPNGVLDQGAGVERGRCDDIGVWTRVW